MTPHTAALMAGYNRWMNDRMFTAAEKLGDAELAADKGAFFGSVLGTLNHIAVADTLWLHRFAGHPVPFPSLGALAALPRPPSLQSMLAPDIRGLGDYRRRLDDLIQGWAAELAPEHLSGTLGYASMAGKVARRNFGELVQHFFNHQTHHRGQVSTLLFQSGVDVGVTDLLALIPDSDA